MDFLLWLLIDVAATIVLGALCVLAFFVIPACIFESEISFNRILKKIRHRSYD